MITEGDVIGCIVIVAVVVCIGGAWAFMALLGSFPTEDATNIIILSNGDNVFEGQIKGISWDILANDTVRKCHLSLYEGISDRNFLFTFEDEKSEQAMMNISEKNGSYAIVVSKYGDTELEIVSVKDLLEA
jgi:hypothetical protein